MIMSDGDCVCEIKDGKGLLFVIQILIIRLLVNNIINILNPYLYY